MGTAGKPGSIAVCFLLLGWGGAAAQADLQLTIRTDSLFQVLDNFGSSAAFELNEITEAWRESALDTLADLLFSTDTNSDGSLRGIGMSGFRVEIGACSYDQGSSSNISRLTARSKCPLKSDGTYDWGQMDAETYWVRKAHAYGLKTVIGYSNSPPVYFTRNGLACRTQTQFVSNLRPDSYGAFAEYLARIAAYYDSIGKPLHYISPVNEPQWTWTCSTQEGTQWSTQEISVLADSVNAAFVRRNVSTNITLTEAGQLDFVYSLVSPNNDNNPSLNQLRLWAPTNPLYVGNRPKVAPILAAHSYWTDDSDARILNIRNNLARAMRDTNPDLRWWQSEFSFLGNGWQALGSNPTRHELGLVLARVIHADLTIGNAAAWQFWETFESTTGHPRYRLVQVNRTAQTAVPERTYWALGHYSRFIRPGMRRMHVQRSDAITIQQTLRDVMPTAFLNPANGDITVVLVNFRTDARSVRLLIPGVGDTTTVRPYLSTADLVHAPQPAFPLGTPYNLPARSLATFVLRPGGGVTRLHGGGMESAPAGKARAPFVVRRAGGGNVLVWSGADLPAGTALSLRDVRGGVAFRHRTAGSSREIPLDVGPGLYYLRVPGRTPMPVVVP